MASDNGGWKDLNEDKLDYDKRCRDREHDDDFLLDRRGMGLRSFVEQELNRRAINSTGSSETLAKGVYLRITSNDEFELTVFRGRGFFDCYICQSREEAVALAEELQQGR